MNSVTRNGVARVGGRVVAFTADAIDNLSGPDSLARKTATGVELRSSKLDSGPSHMYQCGSAAYHPRRKKR